MEGDRERLADTMNANISIHSLRMEGDNCADRDFVAVHISIHSLRMEGDLRNPYPG